MTHRIPPTTAPPPLFADGLPPAFPLYLQATPGAPAHGPAPALPLHLQAMQGSYPVAAALRWS